MALVNIEGLDKLELLHALWKAQNGSPWGGNWDERQARHDLENDHGYIDYCCGKAIKIDFSRPQIDPRLYERDTDARVAHIVAKMRGETTLSVREGISLCGFCHSKQPTSQTRTVKPEKILCSYCMRLFEKAKSEKSDDPIDELALGVKCWVEM